MSDKEAFLLAKREAHARSIANRRKLVIVEERDSSLIAATKAKPGWSVDGVIESKDGLPVLLSYCRAEHSEESLEFIIEASEWRQKWESSTDQARREGADQLMAKFLANGAPQEICVPSGMKPQAFSALMFDTPMIYARTTLIFDIFPRFEESEAAIELKERMAAAAAKTAAAEAKMAAAGAKKPAIAPPVAAATTFGGGSFRVHGSKKTKNENQI